MRGVVPIGVTAPRGATRVMLSPARTTAVGEAPPDREPLAVVEPSSVPCLMLLAIEGLVEVGRADAAHQHAGGVERRGCERLAFDDRRRKANALHRGDALGHLLLVGQRLSSG